MLYGHFNMFGDKGFESFEIFSAHVGRVKSIETFNIVKSKIFI